MTKFIQKAMLFYETWRGESVTYHLKCTLLDLLYESDQLIELCFRQKTFACEL